MVGGASDTPVPSSGGLDVMPPIIESALWDSSPTCGDGQKKNKKVSRFTGR